MVCNKKYAIVLFCGVLPQSGAAQRRGENVSLTKKKSVTRRKFLRNDDNNKKYE